MSYTPVNQDMYLAAYAGALAGMGASQRVPSSSVEASYAGLAAIAGAYSESFDASWNDAAQANTLEIDSAKTLSEATWQTRGPTSATVVTLDSATYDSLTTSLCAMIRAAGTYLAGQGITPSNPGGGTLAGDVVGPSGANVVSYISGELGSNPAQCTVIAELMLVQKMRPLARIITDMVGVRIGLVAIRPIYV